MVKNKVVKTDSISIRVNDKGNSIYISRIINHIIINFGSKTIDIYQPPLDKDIQITIK